MLLLIYKWINIHFYKIHVKNSKKLVSYWCFNESEQVHAMNIGLGLLDIVQVRVWGIA